MAETVEEKPSKVPTSRIAILADGVQNSYQSTYTRVALFEAERVRSSLQRDDRKMLSTLMEVDLKRELVAGLSSNKRLRLRTGRSARPNGHRFGYAELRSKFLSVVLVQAKED